MPPYEDQQVGVILTDKVKRQFAQYIKNHDDSIPKAAKASGILTEANLSTYSSGSKETFVPIDHYLIVCQAEDPSGLWGIESVIRNVSDLEFAKLVEDYDEHYTKDKEGTSVERVAVSLEAPLKRPKSEIGLILEEQEEIPFEMMLCMAEALRRRNVGGYVELFEFEDTLIVSRYVVRIRCHHF